MNFKCARRDQNDIIYMPQLNVDSHKSFTSKTNALNGYTTSRFKIKSASIQKKKVLFKAIFGFYVFDVIRVTL